MSVTYRDTQDLGVDELRALFESVGWLSAKYPERLKYAMTNSHSVVSAWEGDTLIGLINCLSDGVMTAYFHYLLVRPEDQRQGIGRGLLELMLARYESCLRKVLIADNEQVGFYHKCGFVTGTGTSALFLDRDASLTGDVL